MNRLLPIVSSQGFGSPYIMHLHFMVDFGSPKGQTIFLPKNSGEGKQNSCNCPNWFQNAGRNSWRDILHVGVSKIGVPQNGWFIMENPIKMDDLGVPLLLETSMWWNWLKQAKMLLQKMCVFLFERHEMPSCFFHPSILRSSSSLRWCF